ncbi:MAG: GGDEF domain-containing protein [Oscillospiraceae bacterium]|nr:GGDEF domain-containing protein [Oscillospiraceae bacterium]
MSATSDLIFEYLRSLIYDNANAKLDIETLDADYRNVGQGLTFLASMVNEQRAFANALANGDLNAPLPSRDNELAAPLKALHASLKHMTWQSQQVAKGDYKQRIDFMGDFAEAFNTMTEQLEARRTALQNEIEISREKSEALAQSNRLMESITSTLPQMIFVMSDSSSEILYRNVAAAIGLTESLLAAVRDALVPEPETEHSECELKYDTGNRTVYYSVNCYALHWGETNAKAYVVVDISEEHEYMKNLETYAYRDTLTKLYNRFFGMQTLSEWLEAKRAFTFCFVDLDNLKFINDTFGHAEGDFYITTAAALLLSYSEEHIACRIGGDEFMLLVPNQTAKQVENGMKELNLKLQAVVTKNKKEYWCSMSYGCVAVFEDNAIPASDILSLADERMYEFKRFHKKARKAEA